MREQAGYVLVGGRSSRFGRDKALLNLDGRPLAAAVAAQVEAAAGDVTLVGPRARYGMLGLRMIEDRVADFGPLAGIAAALAEGRARWNLIVACDMPRLRVRFLEFLLERARKCGRGAVVPLSPDGREQPLCAVYSSELGEAVGQALGRGERKITRALEGLDVQYVLPPEYARIDPGGEVFTNLNWPADAREAGLG